MTILSRIIQADVWGARDLADFDTRFLPSCRADRLFPAGVDPMRDPVQFFARVNAALYANCDPVVWGRHRRGDNTNADGSLGLYMQACALHIIHGLTADWPRLNTCLEKLERVEIVVPRPSIPGYRDTPGEMRGGFPVWFSPVRPELAAEKYVQEKCRAYDDACWRELVTALALAAAAYEKGQQPDMVKRCKALLSRLVSTALWDADRNGGLGNYHDPRTGTIMPDRDHEPPCVSTDATANLAYGLLVSFAVTGYVGDLMMARKWRGLANAMTVGGVFYPFVRQRRLTLDSWVCVGYDYDFNIVDAALAIWPKIPSGTGYDIGIPPTEEVPKVLARFDLALKQLTGGGKP